MTSKVWFQTAVAIIFTLVIIRLFIEVQQVFSPLFVVVETIFLPLILGGAFFYLTRPVLYFLQKKKFPKWAAITLILSSMALFVWLFYLLLAPIVVEQANSLAANMPAIFQRIEEYGEYLLNQRDLLPDSVREQAESMTGQFSTWASNISSWLFSFLMGLFSGVLALFLAPFFMIYMLVDHKKFAPFVASFFTGERRTWIRKTLHDVDETLKSYIVGQLFVSLILGGMLLIGYSIIGLEYAFLLALIGVMTNVIPFLGPYIAAIPAMMVALVQDPIMAIYVAAIMLISQQIEGDLITPNIMGNVLNVHPLTVITLILAAGNIAGIWGIILAVPFYAVIKVVVANIYSKRKEIEKTATKEV